MSMYIIVCVMEDISFETRCRHRNENLALVSKCGTMRDPFVERYNAGYHQEREQRIMGVWTNRHSDSECVQLLVAGFMSHVTSSHGGFPERNKHVMLSHMYNLICGRHTRVRTSLTIAGAGRRRVG